MFVAHATSIHERKRARNLTAERLVACTRRRVGHKLAVPSVDVVQVRGTGRSKRTNQVHSRRRICVRADHASGIMATRLRSRFDAIDDVTAVIRQAVAVEIG